MGLVSLCPFCVHTTNEVAGQFAELHVIASATEKRLSFDLTIRSGREKGSLDVFPSPVLRGRAQRRLLLCGGGSALLACCVLAREGPYVGEGACLPGGLHLCGSHLRDAERRKPHGVSQALLHRTVLQEACAQTGLALVVGSAVFYLIYYVAFRFFPNSYWGVRDYTDAFSVGDFFDRLLTNRVNDTYWFFYSIIGVYCVVPLLSLAAERKRLLEGMLAAGFVVAFLIPALGWAKVLSPEYQKTLTGVPLLSSSMVFYFLLGYYLRRYVADARDVRLAALVATVASPVLMLLISKGVNAGLPQYDSTPISAGFPACGNLCRGALLPCPLPGTQAGDPGPPVRAESSQRLHPRPSTSTCST